MKIDQPRHLNDITTRVKDIYHSNVFITSSIAITAGRDKTCYKYPRSSYFMNPKWNPSQNFISNFSISPRGCLLPCFPIFEEALIGTSLFRFEAVLQGTIAFLISNSQGGPYMMTFPLWNPPVSLRPCFSSSSSTAVTFLLASLC